MPQKKEPRLNGQAQHSLLILWALTKTVTGDIVLVFSKRISF